jgi:uncharacterized BrkB/YihY/UPF0761 family membrane protein
MVIVAGLFLIVSTAASMLISIRGRLIGRFLPASPQVLETLNIAISNWILAILFALIFRLVPDVRLPWKPIFVGAVLTATLFTAGRGVLDLYLATANVGSMYGAAGSLVVIVMWVYYSAQILLFGAEFTKVYADVALRQELRGPEAGCRVAGFRHGGSMLHVQDGQCGLCAHFGEPHEATRQLNQIRVKHEAPETLSTSAAFQGMPTCI